MNLPSTTSPHLDWALYYRTQKNWSVIPIGKDKRPLINWAEYQTRQPTLEEINKWWTDNPDANIGVVTGKISGIVVMDFDKKHNRNSSEFKMPITVCSRTGGGGEHFIFKHPGGVIKSTNGHLFGPGIDIKADGGYVVLPPSIHESGNSYEWVVDPVSEQPSEMPQWLRQASNKESSIIRAEEIVLGVSEGSRNDSTAFFAGKLLGKFEEHEWSTIVLPTLYAWNKQNNKPPLSDDEVLTTFNSIANLERNKRSGEFKNKEVIISEAISIKDLCEQELPNVQWAVHQLFETGTINMISAAPNQYKSWILQHMAICISKGMPVFGKFDTEQQKVLIVNEEDTPRLLKDRSMMLLENVEDLPLYFHIAKDIKLDGPTVDKLIIKMKHDGITLVMFDSLRSVHSANENDSTEMQLVMEQLKKFTREGMTVLMTHHNRKKSRDTRGGSSDMGGEESRGSSAINAAVHGHISCNPIEDGEHKKLVIHQQKLKGAEKIPPFQVLIQTKDGKMQFIHDGEYTSKVGNFDKTTEKVLNEIENSDKWISVQDIVDMKIAGATVVRQVLRVLSMQNFIQALDRKDVEKMNAPILSAEGKHNERLYFKKVYEDEVEDNY